MSKNDGEDDSSSVDASPPRGRQGRVSPEHSNQQPPAKSPTRLSRDNKDVSLKKTVNTRRGPPLSPRSLSVSVASSTASLIAGAGSNSNIAPPSVAAAVTNNSLSPTRSSAGTDRSNSSSRKRSPSWTYGRDASTNPPPAALASINSQHPPRRKVSTPAFSVNSSSGSMQADEVEEEDLNGWQMFGMQSQSAWGGTSSRPQSRSGKSAKESSESPETAAYRLSKKRSSSPLGEPPVGVCPNAGDVFTRLASSHTLASQAKVIHRDRDYMLSSDPSNMQSSHSANSRKPPLAAEPPSDNLDSGRHEIHLENLET
ncbi:hypothetical protein BC829DRAFT_397907 [Chytridium lagenaria]|nr:hypothetical protein BC829DRAFT_397907 [Chytridium lagenaria]